MLLMASYSPWKCGILWWHKDEAKEQTQTVYSTIFAILRHCFLPAPPCMPDRLDVSCWRLTCVQLCIEQSNDRVSKQASKQASRLVRPHNNNSSTTTSLPLYRIMVVLWSRNQTHPRLRPSHPSLFLRVI